MSQLCNLQRMSFYQLINQGGMNWRRKITFSLFFFFFIYDRHTVREREAETQAEGEAGSLHQAPDVGVDPGSPGSRPGPKAGAKPLRHPGSPNSF